MKEIFQFWLKPSQTIENMEQEEPKKINQRIDIILFLISILCSLQIPGIGLNSISHSDSLVSHFVRILSVLFLFLFFKYVLVFLYWLFSKMLQGNSTIRQIRLIQAYSLTPFLVLLPFACIQFLLTLYCQDNSIEWTFSILIKSLLSLITFRFLVIGLSKVNNFSYGYGILTVLLTGSVFELAKLILGR
jgi:hypothetical protein